jgi:chitin synthase
MATSYINILNVYAFCNWHDVTWGTKGADKAEAMPIAPTTEKTDRDGSISVEVEEYEVPQRDIDSKFNEMVQKISALEKEGGKQEEPVLSEEEQKKLLEESYKNFRTKLVITWIFTYMTFFMS